MASIHPGGQDPRLFARLPGEAGAMPTVARPRAGLPIWVAGIALLIAGVLLFSILDARRRALTAPAVQPTRIDTSPGAPAPQLYIPPDIPVAVALPPVAPTPQPAPAPPPPQPQIIYVPQPAPIVAPIEAPAPPPRASSDPALVVDTGAPPAAAGAGSPAAAAGEAAAAAAAQAVPGASLFGGRARAGMFANRATTVAQGTLIPAVLETALDSTRPGLARAIVSRDVRGFDGSRVLVPRGSRLIGEYRSEVAPGQRRALVNWTRLIRPDGVTIAIGSPAADTLGGSGIRARVNTHFFERFGGAILQSVLDIGGAYIAGRAARGTDGVVIFPGTLTGTSQIVQPQQITNTLTVRQGTSISIFVARDLDFTGAETRR